MSKYSPLADFLKRQGDLVPMTFEQIERITGVKLPASAHRHRPWWSNNPDNSVLTKVWLTAGYESEQVDMEGQKLVFRRRRKTLPAGGAPGEDAPHPLLGALKGLLRIAEGTDLTKPADPEWRAR